MIKFIKKYYISLLLTGLFFVLIIMSIQRIFYRVNTIREQSEAYTQLQLDYALAQEYLDNIHKFKQDNEYLQEFYNQISFFLPNDDDEKIKLFSALEKLAEDTGNESINISVVKAAPSKEGDIVPLADNYLHIKLTLVGNYNDLIYFLTKLENTKNFSDVLDLQITKTTVTSEKDGKKQRDDLLSTTMNVVFYLESEK